MSAKRDGNFVPALQAVSNADELTPVDVWADPTTHRLLVDSTGGGGGGGGTSVADDSAFTPGTTEVTPIGGFFDDVATDSVNEGDVGAVRMSGNRNLYTQIRDSAGNERGANVTASNELNVLDSNSAAIKTAVEIMDDWDETDRAKVNIIAGQAGITAGAGAVAANTPRVTMASDSPDVTSLAILDDWDESDRAKVNLIVGQAGVAGGAGAVSATVQRTTLASDDPAVVALQIMDDWDNAASDGASVSGDVAHDSVDAGEPVKIGGKARTAQPTGVAASDRVDAMFDIYGRQISTGVLREMKGNQITTITSSTSETTVVTADPTYKLDVYAVFVTNTSATATEVSFKDSTAGTTRFTLSVPANDMRGFCLPVDAGHLQTTVNNNWTATCADSVASIIITVMFVKNL